MNGSTELPTVVANPGNVVSFVDDFSKYKMIVHCGGCMLNDREMKNRLSLAKENNIPITNYGILIAYIKGILDRSIEIFS
mgnify:CR=1 FL=1